TLGIACTPVLFGALIDWIDWPLAFLITGVLTALAALAWTVFAADHPGEHAAVNKAEICWITANAGDASAVLRPARPPSSRWTVLFGNRSLMLLPLGYGAVGYFYYIFFSWIHYYFDEVLHLGAITSRYATGLLILGMAVSMPLGGWLADRVQR